MLKGFNFLIKVKPLGFLYGSTGAFLSAENLVGKSGAKFPPDASVLSGLILRTYQENLKSSKTEIEQIKKDLTVAGAFWAEDSNPENFYVPVPRSRVFGEEMVDVKTRHKKESYNEWLLASGKWKLADDKKEVSNEYKWQKIGSWQKSLETVLSSGLCKETPWKFTPILHPKLQDEQRHSLEKDGLFLENAVQMKEDTCLVYLSTYSIPDGWYRFGGESHLVEITSYELDEDSTINELLQEKIGQSFALICPAVWGTNNLSERYPTAFKASGKPPQMLTDRPVPFRYRLGKGDRKSSSTLGVGRYTVPAGTVYVLKHDLNKTWWEFPNEWFPQSKGQVASSQNTLLKQLGCGLCLPITINGVD